MPVIRISEKTLERLKEWAEPLTDTAEAALVKALDAAHRDPSPTANTVAPDPERRATRPSGHSGLTMKELRQPLLETIYEMGRLGPRCRPASRHEGALVSPSLP